MNIRKNNGITLVALVITVILLVIITSISITGTIKSQKETKESSQFSELSMIQHAILERYTKSQLTKEELPGITINISEVKVITDKMSLDTGENITLKGEEYKRLNKADLQELGITGEADSYIVNYSTGEVINETIKVTESKKALYIYSRSQTSNL